MTQHWVRIFFLLPTLAGLKQRQLYLHNDFRVEYTLFSGTGHSFDLFYAWLFRYFVPEDNITALLVVRNISWKPNSSLFPWKPRTWKIFGNQSHCFHSCPQNPGPDFKLKSLGSYWMFFLVHSWDVEDHASCHPDRKDECELSEYVHVKIQNVALHLSHQTSHCRRERRVGRRATSKVHQCSYRERLEVTLLLISIMCKIKRTQKNHYSSSHWG